jgi:tetratricopeptide (TPR) repeat protein
VVKVQKIWSFIFLIIFNSTIILLGPIFTILLYFYLTKEKKEIQELKTKSIDMNQLKLSYPMVDKIYSQGPLENLLKNDKASEDRKVNILSYITNKLHSDDMRLLHSTLSSRSDESRLLCFGAINQIEKKLNDQISDALKAIEITQDTKEKSNYQKKIAHLYWEFIYYQLVSKDLQDFYLHNAKDFALKALKDDYDKVELYLLLGKINLKMKLYDESLEALKEVIKSPYFREGALPYLAELYFEKRNFKALKEVLHEIKKIKYTPKALMISSLWR